MTQEEFLAKIGQTAAPQGGFTPPAPPQGGFTPAPPVQTYPGPTSAPAGGARKPFSTPTVPIVTKVSKKGEMYLAGNIKFSLKVNQQVLAQALQTRTVDVEIGELTVWKPFTPKTNGGFEG